MTQVCDFTATTDTTAYTRPSIGDRVLAAQLAELDASQDCHLTDLRGVLVLAISLHDEAIEAGAPPAQGLVRLRETGARWAVTRRPLDPLLHMLRGLTEKVVQAAVADRAHPAGTAGLATLVRTNGAAFVREILTGFQQSYDADDDVAAPLDQQLLASSLLWSEEVPAELRAKAAAGYAVVAVHRDGGDDDLGVELDNAFWSCGARGALSLVTGDDGFVLAPAADEASALTLCREVQRRLGGDVWFAVSWRSRQEVSAGRQQASSVLALARGGGRPPGTYQVGDVLVEYAVMQDSSVMSNLVSLITPILRQEALRTTLEVFIDANGNRSKAASVLKIHRSTLDYRLSRIEQLTGCQPTSARGVQMLATALGTYNALHGAPAADIHSRRTA
jgi:DNA-binding protein Fis